MPASASAVTIFELLAQAAAGVISWSAVTQIGSDIIDKMRAEGRTVPTADDLAPLDTEFNQFDAQLSADIAQAKAEGR